MVSGQGNGELSKFGKWRGPGVGSPKTLHTLYSLLGCLATLKRVNLWTPYPTIRTDGFLDFKYDPVPTAQPRLIRKCCVFYNAFICHYLLFQLSSKTLLYLVAVSIFAYQSIVRVTSSSTSC